MVKSPLFNRRCLAPAALSSPPFPPFFNAEFFLLPPRKKGKGAFFVTSEF